MEKRKIYNYQLSVDNYQQDDDNEQNRPENYDYCIKRV